MGVYWETQSNAELATRSSVRFDIKPFGGIKETQRRAFRDLLGLGVFIPASQQYLMKLAKHVVLTARHGAADGSSLGATSRLIGKCRGRLLANDKVASAYPLAESTIDRFESEFFG